MSTATKLMTAEEFLALPDDGVERWLIRGELREKQDTDMTMRNKVHSITEARVTARLGRWLETQPQPRGEVVCGEAGFLLRQNPDTVSAGADVAIITAAQADARSPDTTLVEGPAVMIAEILSPNDTTEEVVERVEEYLACGVRLVWVINPDFGTVAVHRPGAEPVQFNRTQTITGDPELPGFSCPVADFFR
ncbi:MAG TPA: Uma2 family endonuclease [Gemmataceae bacterium]|nr:Uma2 family endonuclease [Gemmataceae bacterium]